MERGGRPVAVIVPVKAYEGYRRLCEQAFGRIDALRERLARELNPRVEALIEEETRAVRTRR